MDIYTIFECSNEFDCGDYSGEIVSHHSTLEGAEKAIEAKKTEYLSEDFGCEVLSDTKYDDDREIVRYICMRNYCSNLTLQIIKKTLNED